MTIDAHPAAPRHAPASEPTPRATGARRLRIALAHDWLVSLRGGERVLDDIVRMLRDRHEVTRLYTMFDAGGPISPAIDLLPRTTARLSNMPLARGALRRWMLPLYPRMVADLSRALARDHAHTPIDLLISTSSAAIKGLRPPEGVPHLCYCHTPARYVWSQQQEYARAGSLQSLGLRAFAPHFRAWDRRTAANVTRFVANSAHTAREIKRCYDRDASVVHPPVQLGAFSPGPPASRRDFWLVVSALEPYKRVDLAIDAARHRNHPLVIVGTGSMRRPLEQRAGPSVRFVGRPSDEELRDLYRRARLLLFPQIEDFGIVALEAQACATPVVARAAGGALETVVDGATGAMFEEPTPDALLNAIDRCPDSRDDEVARACTENAARFAEDRFMDAMRNEIDAVLRA
ncbi:MAG: glycosyltransferase [Phycisphaerales bacterium]|nr:glycosyltransferase [Phycisphaerales bacterium]